MAMSTAQAAQLEISTPMPARKRRKGLTSSLSATSISAYLGVFLLVMSLVAISYQAPERKGALATAGVQQVDSSENASSSAVDKLMATNVGATIAESADMPVSKNVANLSTSLTIESLLAQNDTNTISKPQIVQPSADSRTIQKYTTAAGDTVPALAQKFGVSAQTIKWANKLTSDALEPGKELTIPPVDGVLYTIRAGDTIDTIASKYKADKSYLMTFNDLELTGNPAVGSQIIIPSGQLPSEEQPGYVAPRTSVPSSSYAGINYGSYTGGSSNGGATGWSGGRSPGNLYGTGQCTFYAYERRLQLGNPIGGQWGNANTWAYSGASAGFRVDRNPAPGAIIQNGGGYGHVAIVESINPGVSVSISEMNGYRWGGGWNRVGYGTISWAEATSGMYNFIH
jgi:surface antigen